MRGWRPLLIGWLCACSAAAGGAPLPDWTAPVTGTKTLLLVTGADLGYAKPSGCRHGEGGAQLRREFAAWWNKQAGAALTTLWLSTGNIAAAEPDHDVASLDVMHAMLREIGYRAVGIGETDLRDPGPAQLLAQATKLPAKQLSCNLVRRSDGTPLLDATLVLDTPSGKIALVGVSPHRGNSDWELPQIGRVGTTPPLVAVHDTLKRLDPTIPTVILLASVNNVEVAKILARVKGIDLVVASFGTYAQLQPETIHGVPVLWVGGMGDFIGRVALDERGAVLAIDSIPVRPAANAR